MAQVCRVPTAHRSHAGSVLVIVLLALLVGGCAGSMNRDDLRQEIRAALRDDPQLVLDALRGREVELIQLVDKGAQDREVFGKQNQRLAELANPYQPVLERNRPVRGPATAPITIVEYADFECPFCAQAHHTVQQILKRYDGQVRFLYKHNPIDQIHPMADPTARWFEAIARQSHEKAWAFHDRLYEAPDLLKQGESGMESVVASLGLDAEQVRRDFVSEEITAQVQRDRTEAMSFGFQGTPAFLINGVSLRGAYPLDEFVQVIELVRERHSTPGIASQMEPQGTEVHRIAEDRSPPPPPPSDYVPNELVVKVKAGVMTARVEEINRKLNAQVKPLVPGHGLYRLQFPPGSNLKELMKAYQELPEVEYAEPNYLQRSF